MVNYFRTRLTSDELHVYRNSSEVDLSDLNTSTKIYRVDIISLLNTVFVKHDLRDGEDKRRINYTKDQLLWELLTSEEPLETEIRNGTYKVTIFNILKFCARHICGEPPFNDSRPRFPLSLPSVG